MTFARRRLLVKSTALITVLLLISLSLSAFAPSAGAAPITASLALSKGAFVSGTNTLLTSPVTPGDAYDYQLAAACSGLTQGCINATTVDVLPPGVDFVGADTSPLYTVAYNAATRTVTVTYTDALLSPPNPAGSHGMFAGSTRTAVLHVKLDPAATAPDGIQDHQHCDRLGRQRLTRIRLGRYHGVGAAPGDAGGHQVVLRQLAGRPVRREPRRSASACATPRARRPTSPR